MPSEAELVQRAIQRDAAAFGELYSTYLNKVYRYIYYKVGNATEAEDLTEQVFLQAWEAIDRYRQQGAPFAAWLFRLAHNRVIDYHRTKKSHAPLDPSLEDSRPGPEEIVARRLDVQNLKQALKRLTEEQQQVILLRFVEGMSHAEVGAIIGKSEGAVRSIQYRALLALGEILKPSAPS